MKSKVLRVVKSVLSQWQLKAARLIYFNASKKNTRQNSSSVLQSGPHKVVNVVCALPCQVPPCLSRL